MRRTKRELERNWLSLLGSRLPSTQPVNHQNHSIFGPSLYSTFRETRLSLSVVLFSFLFSHLRENDSAWTLALSCPEHRFHKLPELRDLVYPSTGLAWRGVLAQTQPELRASKCSCCRLFSLTPPLSLPWKHPGESIFRIKLCDKLLGHDNDTVLHAKYSLLSPAS